MQFLDAARRFANEQPPRLNHLDLGVACLLEYFSWPLLCFLPYERLAERQLMPPPIEEFKDWFHENAPPFVLPLLKDTPTDINALAAWIRENVPEDQQEIAEALSLLGQGLTVRFIVRREDKERANLISRIMLASAILLHLLVILSLITSPTLLLILIWPSAVAFASLICVRNRHWRPRGLRRVSGRDS